MSALEEAREEVDSISGELQYILDKLKKSPPISEDLYKLNEAQRALADTSWLSRTFGTEPYGGEKGVEAVKRLIRDSSDYVLGVSGSSSDISKLTATRITSFSERLEACLLAHDFVF